MAKLKTTFRADSFGAAIELEFENGQHFHISINRSGTAPVSCFHIQSALEFILDKYQDEFVKEVFYDIDNPDAHKDVKCIICEKEPVDSKETAFCYKCKPGCDPDDCFEIQDLDMEKHMSKLKQELQDVGINPIEFIVDALTFKSLDEFKK